MIVKSSIRSLVIQGFLNGKSRNQITIEAKISTGKTSNIIKDWKSKIDISDVEDLRNYAVEVRKSGISIVRCVQGYRMVKLMKNLGIVDGNDDNNNYIDYNKNIDHIHNKAQLDFFYQI